MSTHFQPTKALALLLGALLFWFVAISLAALCFLGSAPHVGWAIAVAALVLLLGWLGVMGRELARSVAGAAELARGDDEPTARVSCGGRNAECDCFQGRGKAPRRRPEVEGRRVRGTMRRMSRGKGTAPRGPLAGD